MASISVSNIWASPLNRSSRRIRGVSSAQASRKSGHVCASQAFKSQARVAQGPSDPCPPRQQAALAALAAAVIATTPISSELLQPTAAHAALVDEANSVRIFQQSASSVVSIVNYNGSNPESIGTGIVWDGIGDIVTNYHCISKIDKRAAGVTTKIVVTYEDGSTTTLDCDLVGSDSMHDIAVLRLASPPPAGDLLPIKVGTSKDLKVGQAVYAIGNNSGGLTKTLSAGLVSGLDRSIPSPVGTRIYGVIQTDASINPGNSGGPLLDSSGRLVGMNTASFTRAAAGRGSGVNFALPVDLLMQVVPNIAAYGNALGKL